MRPSSSQIDQLQREIASGQLVVVVGSGVSVAACGQQVVVFDPQLRLKLIA
jgi:hypothetical protein